jgi:LPXTG-site transpeptidase (sortase) family protein
VVEGQWNIAALESGIGHLETTGRHPGDDVGMTFIAHVTRPWPEIAGPFADLIFMQPGDEIIYRWQGIDYVYALESFARVKPEAVESLYVPDGDVITLATCDTWDFVNFGYEDRLLARARLVREEPTLEETPQPEDNRPYRG